MKRRNFIAIASGAVLIAGTTYRLTKVILSGMTLYQPDPEKPI